jgi:acyl carrier protein
MKWKTWLFYKTLSSLMSLRYRIEVKGLDKLEDQLRYPGGFLLLPNHPARVDSILLYLAIWKKFLPRPAILEKYYYASGIHSLVKGLGAVPFPDFDLYNNSFKRMCADKSLAEIVKGLEQGDHFTFYPAGSLKRSAREEIGGQSGLNTILGAVTDKPNIVLARMSGLWGSSFSHARETKDFNVIAAFKLGIKTILKNGIFFAPRRKITVDFEVAGEDFPYNGSRLEINKYLENWYNKPWGEEGEPCTVVPYSHFQKTLPEVNIIENQIDVDDISDVSDHLKSRIRQEIALMANKKIEELSDDMSLSNDLGLDSLDAAELVVMIGKEFGVKKFFPSDLKTVSRTISIAAGIYKVDHRASVDTSVVPPKWHKNEGRLDLKVADATTMIRAFLNNCDRNDKAIACADPGSGAMTYRQMKMRVIILAEKFAKFPDKHIGVMLPSSAGVYIIVLACWLAGKVPVMMNWTLGPRYLDAMADVADVNIVLSSWKFLDKLHGVELGSLNEKMYLLEGLKDEISIGDKIRAFGLAHRNTPEIMSAFEGGSNLRKKDPAVILFTSGSEGVPKAVPLSHDNILNNYKSSLQAVDLRSTDIMISTLPPFHSFGFAITGLLPLILGMRVVYYPDPTDYSQIGAGIEKWGATMVCSAPSFLKGILQTAKLTQLSSLRLLVAGSERTPQQLFDAVEALGNGAMLLEGYGITECAPVVSINDPETSPRGVGRPIPGVEVCVADIEHKKPLPTGQQGIVLVSGKNVFNGYYKGGKASPFVEMENKKWYVTGDLGIIDEQGYLRLSGRLKRFVKIAGEMVSLGAIEQILIEKLAPPSETPVFAVCAEEKDDVKTKLILCATHDVDVNTVNNTLKEAGLSSLIRISVVKKFEELPTTAIGKVNYPILEKQQGEK